MTELKDSLPGVIFYRNSSQVMASSTPGVKKVKVVLVAEVRDDAVWESVEEKFTAGLKVYTADDFKGEMLNALREDYARLEAEKKRLQLELSTAKATVERMTAALSVLNHQLEG